MKWIDEKVMSRKEAVMGTALILGVDIALVAFGIFPPATLLLAAAVAFLLLPWLPESRQERKERHIREMKKYVEKEYGKEAAERYEKEMRKRTSLEDK